MLQDLSVAFLRRRDVQSLLATADTKLPAAKMLERVEESPMKVHLEAWLMLASQILPGSGSAR